MSFHIRYTCSGKVQEDIVDFITRNAQKYIVAREIATREHIQCYVETNITKKTWVNKFNIKFRELDRRDKYVEPDKGNTKYYVCKDGDIIAKRGFTEEDIVSYRQKYLDNKVPLESSENLILPPETKVEKTKKARKPPFMMEVRQSLEDTFPEKDWSKEDKPIVFKTVMKMLGEYNKSLDHIIISRMVYGVMNSLIKDKKDWLEYWYKKSFGEELNPYDDKSDIFTDSKYCF